ATSYDVACISLWHKYCSEDGVEVAPWKPEQFYVPSTFRLSARGFCVWPSKRRASSAVAWCSITTSIPLSHLRFRHFRCSWTRSSRTRPSRDCPRNIKLRHRLRGSQHPLPRLRNERIVPANRT